MVLHQMVPVSPLVKIDVVSLPGETEEASPAVLDE